MTTISVQVDESWYFMKHQLKHHQVFIWGETYFSSEIKHLHFNGVLLINTTHGNNEIPARENISLHNYAGWRSQPALKIRERIPFVVLGVKGAFWSKPSAVIARVLNKNAV